MANSLFPAHKVAVNKGEGDKSNAWVQMYGEVGKERVRNSGKLKNSDIVTSFTAYWGRLEACQRTIPKWHGCLGDSTTWLEGWTWAPFLVPHGLQVVCKGPQITLALLRGCRRVRSGVAEDQNQVKNPK